MIFHENRWLADDSPYFFSKILKEVANLSSAAVVIGALRVNIEPSGIVKCVQSW